MANAASGWIGNLLNPDAYPHPTRSLRILETHISWVVLTGRYAYKIKKPVNFGFLDFSNLAQRHACCCEEIRINRRLAPSIYLDVVPITGSVSHPQIGRKGTPFEYAVRMRQFDPDALYSKRVQHHRLTVTEIDQLADLIAGFHARIPAAPVQESWGDSPSVWRAIAETLDLIWKDSTDDFEEHQIDLLRGWLTERYVKLSPLIEARKHDGFVRECHGDLHLSNITEIAGQPVPFDGIEFNPALRWIDVVSEVAFLTMDLAAYGAPDLAFRFINRYEETTGDYDGLALWSFYACYRALVRAKVARLSTRTASDAVSCQRHIRGSRRYLERALTYVETSRPTLIIMHGLSGSGKSTLAEQLAMHLRAVRVRSDVERRRLEGGQALDRYSDRMTELTYQRLVGIADRLLRSDLSAILDATFLRVDQRTAAAAVARRLGLRFRIIDVRTTRETLESRIAARSRVGTDPSEASLAVLERQIVLRQDFTPEELPNVLSVNGQALDMAPIAASIEG